MAELSRGAEDEQNQEPVTLPVNYSPEVEAAIQEVILIVRSRAMLYSWACRCFLALMN